MPKRKSPKPSGKKEIHFKPNLVPKGRENIASDLERDITILTRTLRQRGYPLKQAVAMASNHFGYEIDRMMEPVVEDKTEQEVEPESPIKAHIDNSVAQEV